MSFVLGSYKTSKSPHPPTRILRVYIESLAGFNYVYCPDGLNNTFFCQGYVLETAAAMRIVVRTYIPKSKGVQWGASYCPRQACRWTSGYVLLMTSSKHQTTQIYTKQKLLFCVTIFSPFIKSMCFIWIYLIFLSIKSIIWGKACWKCKETK